jgi:hypothetical protein
MPEISDLLKLLLKERDSFTWKDVGSCRGMPTEWFFEQYEKDAIHARQVDETCLNCPVARACLLYGGKNKEDGVWGGVYLVNGKKSDQYNEHKTEEFWQKYNEKMGIGHADE